MISDYCDFTMSSTFNATGQLLDVKRAGDRKLARLRRRFSMSRSSMSLSLAAPAR